MSKEEKGFSFGRVCRIVRISFPALIKSVSVRYPTHSCSCTFQLLCRNTAILGKTEAGDYPNGELVSGGAIIRHDEKDGENS